MPAPALPEGQRGVPRYVLVTPVRNEEATLGITLECILAQTVPPLEWVIVDDGSTDQTPRILERAVRRHHFIHTLRRAPGRAHSFAAVVEATRAGLAALRSTDHDFVGLLDADLRFGPRYFEELFQRFGGEPQLGLAGGRVVDCIDGRRLPILQATAEVAGAVQCFRRECLEAIGELVAIPEGGWDALSCAMARRHGYRTRTFRELEVLHLKPRNVSQGGAWRRHFQLGVRDHALGHHPLFEGLKCARRALERPRGVGGLARLIGFAWATASRRPRHVPAGLVAWIRAEQLARLGLASTARHSTTTTRGGAANRLSA